MIRDFDKAIRNMVSNTPNAELANEQYQEARAALFMHIGELERADYPDSKEARTERNSISKRVV